ncbi:MAG TPA: hypothetical protein VFC19_32585 [Candidatus Limnocylindrales bacterium]|nr:hypothetical protein [Candidatus Limnocylindrales bacterium]
MTGLLEVLVLPLAAVACLVTMYALVLLMELPLLAMGVVTMDAQHFVVRPIVGSIFGLLAALAASLKQVLWAATDGNYRRRPMDVGDELFKAFSWRIALALFIACVVVVQPGRNLQAFIALGTAYGVVFAVLTTLMAVLEDPRGTSRWDYLVIVEVFFAFSICIGLIFSGLAALHMIDKISGLEALEFTVATGLAAAFAYGTTFASIYLIDKVAKAVWRSRT